MSRLRRPLAVWMVMWVMAKGLSVISESQALDYILEGPKSDASNAIATTVSSDFMKMLNLCHSWVDSLLPHVLSKINRVTYGLLTEEEMKRLLQIDPQMPKVLRFLSIFNVGSESSSSTVTEIFERSVCRKR